MAILIVSKRKRDCDFNASSYSLLTSARRNSGLRGGDVSFSCDFTFGNGVCFGIGDDLGDCLIDFCLTETSF